MPMSPRLLRPRATGFDPRSISGCICNLDASVLSSLRQNSDGTTAAAATNDPIGYVQDLSGMGNHARQSVATGSRPSLRLNNQNGRPGLLFDGSNDWLTATIAGFQSLANVTVIMVFKTAVAAGADTDSGRFWSFGNLGAASGPYRANSCISGSSTTGALSGETLALFADIGSNPPSVLNTGRLGSTTYTRAANTAQMFLQSCGTSGTSVIANNQAVTIDMELAVTKSTAAGPSATGYTVDNDVHIAAIRNAGSILTSLVALTLHQMIVYDRVLTTAESTAIWNAMRGKWGIT